MQFSEDVQEALSSHSPAAFQLDRLETELRATEKQINSLVLDLLFEKKRRAKLKKKLKTWGRL